MTLASENYAPKGQALPKPAKLTQVIKFINFALLQKALKQKAFRQQAVEKGRKTVKNKILSVHRHG